MTIGIKKQPRPMPSSQSFMVLKRRAAESVLLPRHPEALQIAGEAVNDALRRMNTRRWRWSIRKKVVGVVADKRDYEVPGDFSGVVDGTWLDVNQRETFPVIDYIDPFNFGTRFLSMNPQSRESYQFTVMNEYEFAEPLRFAYPVDPGRIGDHPFFLLRYYSVHPRLEAESDTFQAPPEVELWVAMYAKSALAATYAPERWPVLRKEAEAMWVEIAKSDMMRNVRAI